MNHLLMGSTEEAAGNEDGTNHCFTDNHNGDGSSGRRRHNCDDYEEPVKDSKRTRQNMGEYSCR